jgi:hypothetical protein
MRRDASSLRSSSEPAPKLMDILLAAINSDDRATVKDLIKKSPALATESIQVSKLYQAEVFHWIYVGDTALHLASAGYRVEIVRALLAAGADPNAATNQRRSTPFHYASDGYIVGPAWNEARQLKTISALLAAGAHVNAQDKNGATALHRAVRTRCAAAVRLLMASGADPLLRNNSGSTPFHLAVQNTGRGGSGAEESREAQKKIVQTFLAFPVSPEIKDGRGKSVRECAGRTWVREMFD